MDDAGALYFDAGHGCDTDAGRRGATQPKSLELESAGRLERVLLDTTSFQRSSLLLSIPFRTPGFCIVIRFSASKAVTRWTARWQRWRPGRGGDRTSELVSRVNSQRTSMEIGSATSLPTNEAPVSWRFIGDLKHQAVELGDDTVVPHTFGWMLVVPAYRRYLPSAGRVTGRQSESLPISVYGMSYFHLIKQRRDAFLPRSHFGLVVQPTSAS